MAVAADERRENACIAQQLREMADVLESQGDNPFRVLAYRHGAQTLEDLPGGVRALAEREGSPGLQALPGIGPRLAAAILEMLQTGAWRALDHARGDADPEALLRSVPGIGAALAHRIHATLGVATLEALEVAAHDGRLERLPGVGPRTVQTIRATLHERLRRTRGASGLHTDTAPLAVEPEVGLLLDVDREYRARALAGRLPTIAPRRFNPEAIAWLPVLHTQRGDWHLTALYSNTARAHRLGHVRDWVVIYAEDAAHHEHSCTVVTASHGPLAGRRVVRGREAACQAWYQQARGPAALT